MSGNMRTPLARIRGLGSAKDGTEHWWRQRVSALINLPLLLWLVVSIAALAGRDHATAVQWLSHPVAATLIILALVNLFYHIRLGLQVAVEDYIHKEGTKILLLVLITLFTALFGLMAVLAVLKLALGS